MKSCKRWTTTGSAACSLCRATFRESTAGILVDLTTPVENTTIVKFICIDCATPIATAVVGEETAKRAARGGR
jgi:hypothetical protein